MAAQFYETEVALFRAVSQVMPTIPIDYPNHELKHKPANSVWIQVHNLRAATEPATLGRAGTDENRGVLQIDFNHPKGNGSGSSLRLGNIFQNAFPIGRKIVYNDRNDALTIHKTALSSGRNVGNYYRISLSLNYSYRTQRY